MNIPKPEGLLSVVLPSELQQSSSSRQLFASQDQQDEEASDCPLLTPSPPASQLHNPLNPAAMFNPHEASPMEVPSTPTIDSINTEDGLNFINIVNSSSKPLHDEPSSRDPMVETSSSGSSSDTNEPVCTQLLTQLNTAYQHLAPDAQALFYNQENGGKPPLVGIQLVVPKSKKDYRFMKWNWPLIRKTCFWTLMSLLAGCTALVIGVIATMPRKCDPPVEWWQGSVFYEIFPASFQDSSKGGDGVGDLRGITTRLDYLKKLGVRGIRLNSIFPATHYPEYYANISSLTELNKELGTLEDFANLARETHRRNMSLILDLPLHPFVKNLPAGQGASRKPNKTDKAVRERRGATEDPVLRDFDPAEPSTEAQTTRDVLPAPAPRHQALLSSHVDGVQDHPVTRAIETWLARQVDGFYLKGLEHYVHEETFPDALRHWKSLLGANRIIICHMNALSASKSSAARNTILNRVDLVDVSIEVSNGTASIKSQVEQVLNGVLFEKPSYPWVHWSVGSVDSKRIASRLSVRNATIAISLLGMLLPGTSNIFYGDEKGIMDCACDEHQDLAHVHNLAPMHWDKKDGSIDKFSSESVIPWLPIAQKPVETSLTNCVAEMAKLRSETTSVYVKAVLKNNQAKANCDIRYTKDEMIVLERWYPRRNTYAFVANLGNETRSKDLSSLYYGGHVVVGPEYRLHRDVYFKELKIPPGEAFVIKLDK